MDKKTENAWYSIPAGLLMWIIPVFGLLGYIQCCYKMADCNWDPIGKAEVLYTIGVFTGTGTFIGWFDIEDN